MTSTLSLPDGHFLAYHKTTFAQDSTTDITIVFLGGLMSDMNGTKAMALETYCKKQRYNFVRFDYIGHGESSGAFTDGTISLWKANALAIIDKLTTGPLLLIGSSLGGWLMHLAALERPERVKALLGIASAPDFTETLMWDSFSDVIKEQIQSSGIYQMPSDYNDTPYPITRDLIEDGRKHLLLQGPIPIPCPIRLIHGMHDDDVPHHFSTALAERYHSHNVRVILDKAGDHRMSSDEILLLIYNSLEELIELLIK